MFKSFNYYRQYNENQPITDHKTFYKKFSSDREWGGDFSHLDHLVKNRFSESIHVIFASILRRLPNAILDVGCGNGVNLPLSKIFGIEYHGLDYAEKTIEAARKTFPNVEFHVGDAFDINIDGKRFDYIILSLVIVLYEDEDDQVRLIRSCLRSLSDDGVLAIVVLNDAAIVRWSVKLATLLGKFKKENLPQDFMAVHFDRKSLAKIVEKGGGNVAEYIRTGANYGILESVRYLNMSKFRRTFGKAESEVGIHPQAIYDDLRSQSKGPEWLVRVLYQIGRFAPTLFSFYAVCLVEKANPKSSISELK